MDKVINMPTVSIVMSVYNGEQYLNAAIDSILAQTFEDFEFVIINDGSTDGSGRIIKSYKDSRIVLLEQENKGLVESLNRGIKTARGKYIARQDADDTSHKNRLKYQLAEFNKNPNLVLIGSSMEVMDEKSNILHKHHVLLQNPELKQELLVRSPFAHGSTMFRRASVIKAGLYRKNYWPAEDYDLWLRLSTSGDFANVNEPQYIYRENSAGISLNNESRQLKKADEVRRNAWKSRGELIPRDNINIEVYKKLDDGTVRIERIRDNITSTAVKAAKKGDIRTAVRLYKLKRKING